MTIEIAKMLLEDVLNYTLPTFIVPFKFKYEAGSHPE